MRGKMALYGYLHGLAAAPPPPNPTLTVASMGVAGATGTITSDPPGIDCGDDCSEAFAGGTEVTLTALPDAGSNFVGWDGACFGTDPTCELTMTLNRSVTASFEPVGLTYILDVTRTGTGDGTVTSSPAGIDCGDDCEGTYLGGTSVQLTAAAGADSTFTGWGGACSGMGDCTVTMNAARSVIASFRSDTTPEVMIYDDALAPGWADWSWNDDTVIDLAGASPVMVGTNAVNAVTMSAWGAFSPAMTSGVIDTSFGYEAIRFWVHGGSGSNKPFVFFSEGDGGSSTSIGFTAVANTWTEVTMTLDELGSPPSISRLNFQNNSASTIGMVTFDHIRLEPTTGTVLFRDDFESGDTSAWSAAVWSRIRRLISP
jgi:hypothetical protein